MIIFTNFSSIFLHNLIVCSCNPLIGLMWSANLYTYGYVLIKASSLDMFTIFGLALLLSFSRASSWFAYTDFVVLLWAQLILCSSVLCVPWERPLYANMTDISHSPMFSYVCIFIFIYFNNSKQIQLLCSDETQFWENYVATCCSMCRCSW